jgi:RNA polymerase sigma-70 factor, ECF subfamily
MDSLASGMTSRLPLSAADSEPERAQADSRAWLDALRSTGTGRDAAITRLHELLLRAARFEVSRRRAALAHVRGEELDDIALQAADDALVAVLAKLDDYRGASRFTTWAYKFALLRRACGYADEPGRNARLCSSPKAGRSWLTPLRAPRAKPSRAS